VFIREHGPNENSEELEEWQKLEAKERIILKVFFKPYGVLYCPFTG